jgi:hypothetical protein
VVPDLAQDSVADESCSKKSSCYLRMNRPNYWKNPRWTKTPSRNCCSRKENCLSWIRQLMRMTSQ